MPSYSVENNYSAAVTTTSVSESAVPHEVTSIKTSDSVNNVFLDDIFEESITTYGESGDISEPDSEQTTAQETAVGNEYNQDNPPKTGNAGSFIPITGITALSLAAIGTATLYNKKRKR